MLNKEFKFSTQWKVSQIIEKLEGITTGKSLNGKKKIGPYYVGEYDETGFRFKRSHPIGDCIFSSKFIEQESKTDIIASIKPGVGSIVTFIVIIGLMLVLLFKSNIEYDFLKLTTLILIFLIPALIWYIGFLADVKRAKVFLMELFQREGLSL
jgi:hypothetical protein